MQIAQIVPKTRTQKEAIFDYSIPPELLVKIKIGVLVLVPFHGRKISGIVLDLKRSSKIENLKSIIKIIDEIPVVDEAHIKLAKWMAEYYITSLGKTIFENVVPPAIRSINKFSSAPVTHRQYFSKRHISHGKKYLLVGDFKTRLNFYIKSAQKTLKYGQSIIILVPDLSLIKYFTKYLSKEVVILHSNLSKTQRWLAWQKIRSGAAKIVIGSQSALFAPINNLGLIIIDQEENETYKNDQAPRFRAVTVAEHLSKMTGANLILGSLTPSIESYFKSVHGIYYLKKTQQKNNPDITVVHMNKNFQAISDSLQTAIENKLKNNEKIVLVLNRKGEGTRFGCSSCDWTAYCDKCGLPLTPQKEKLVCYRCENKSLPLEVCLKCNDANLKAYGLGVNKLEKFILDFWPKVKIIQINETVKNQNTNLLKNRWDIAIVTNFALKLAFPPIGLVGIIDADQGFNFPDFRIAEKNYHSLYKFLSIAKEGIIQTRTEENPAVTSLAKFDYELFFLNELQIRKKYHFPPFYQLIRLLVKENDNKLCKTKAQAVYQILDTIIKSNKIENISISQPTPAFYKKKGNNFRWQILLKIDINKSITTNSNVIKTLKELPPNWIVDVDPIDLL